MASIWARISKDLLLGRFRTDIPGSQDTARSGFAEGCSIYPPSSMGASLTNPAFFYAAEPIHMEQLAKAAE